MECGGKLRSFWPRAGFALAATSSDQDLGEKAADIGFLITSGHGEGEEILARRAELDQPQNDWSESCERGREGVYRDETGTGFRELRARDLRRRAVSARSIP